MTTNTLTNRRMRTKAAAEYLGLSEKTLNNWRSTRSDGPPYLKVGASVVYLQSDLDAWLNQCRRTSTSDKGGLTDNV